MAAGAMKPANLAQRADSQPQQQLCMQSVTHRHHFNKLGDPHDHQKQVNTFRCLHLCAMLSLLLLLYAVSARPQRELQQVTLFYNTPGAAGSTSLDVTGNLGVSQTMLRLLPTSILSNCTKQQFE